jgi:hypothetical protein
MTLNVFEKHFSLIFEVKIYNIKVMYTYNFIDNYYISKYFYLLCVHNPSLLYCLQIMDFFGRLGRDIKSYVCGINSRHKKRMGHNISTKEPYLYIM